MAKTLFDRFRGGGAIAWLCTAVLGAGTALGAGVAGPTISPERGGDSGRAYMPAPKAALAEARAANHPALDAIPAMPMPEPNPLGGGGARDGTTWHNAQTGQTWDMPVLPPDGKAGGVGGQPFEGVGNHTTQEPTAEGFGTMSVAGGLTSFPASANVMLYQRYVDQNGFNRYYVCSGALNDAGVVQTAAHCVYARNPNGINIFNWAAEMWVYPAWNGSGSYGFPGSTEVINNWGVAHAFFFMAGTDYINNGNTDRDCGAVSFGDRSVGFLTGWYGWTWGFDCAFAQARFYNNYSYPAESCGGGLHTGRTMYYWGGTPDACPNNQFQINTTAGCLTALWGGQSGSNAYYFENNGRWAHAVASTSNRNDRGYYCKLWQQWTTDLESFKGSTRGGGLDIEALAFRCTGSTTVQASTALPLCTMQVPNSSNADPASQTYTVQVYLSNDDLITGGDTLLATWFYTVDYAGFQNITYNVPGPTIPANTPAGTYFVGAIVTAPGDVDTSNNATRTWDTTQIQVTAAPPSNDACAGARNLQLNVVQYGSTTTANTEGSSSCVASAAKDVWFYFYPTCTDTYTFDTCGSDFDTVLSVHTSCPGTTANQLAGACNDDDFNAHCSTNIRNSWLSVGLNAYQNYWIRLSGYSGLSGNYAIRASHAPVPNDNCASPFYINEGVFQYNNCGATTDGPDEPALCNAFSYSHVESDTWWAYIPTATGTTTVSLCGSTYDTKIAVYDNACPLSSNTAIACNDDYCGVQSQLSFHAEFGHAYFLRIGGYHGAQGIYNLNVSIVPQCVADVDDGSFTGTPDGGVTLDDLLYYLYIFDNGFIAADVDDGSFTGTPDGGVTLDDLLYFLYRFDLGC